MFPKIVRNRRRLGIPAARDGRLRAKFEELDNIRFEHLIDTTEEYRSLDAIETPGAATP